MGMTSTADTVTPWLVDEHNLLMLRSLGRPIAVIKGVHNNSDARRADSNTAGS